MNNNDWCLFVLLRSLVGRLMILLHSLQEQGCIHTESEDFLQIGHIVIQEGESADWEWAHRFLEVVILWFSAQVVNLDHIIVMCLQEVHYVRLPVPVQSLKSFSWETARYNSICNVGQIEIILSRPHSIFIRGDDWTYEITVAAWAGPLLSFVILFLWCYDGLWATLFACRPLHILTSSISFLIPRQRLLIFFLRSLSANLVSVWDAVRCAMVDQVKLDFLGYMTLLVLFFVLFGAYLNEFGQFHVDITIFWV